MTDSLSSASRGRLRRRFAVAGLIALLLTAGTVLTTSRSAAEKGRAIPAPVVEEKAAPDAATEVAVLAGGCFWGIQGVFQHLKGVSSAVSGYAGGEAAAAQYKLVSGGDTAHAEAVRVTFDPKAISYARILQVFFSVAHDPTQLNRQYPDVGPQYRSAIFPANPEQAQIAKAYIAQLNQARAFDAAIVTKIEPDHTFYPAESYHQDYMTLNPTSPYIAMFDLPKVNELKRLFPEAYRQDPILVLAAKPAN